METRPTDTTGSYSRVGGERLPSLQSVVGTDVRGRTPTAFKSLAAVAGVRQCHPARIYVNT
jgi:hypothetical protein